MHARIREPLSPPLSLAVRAACRVATANGVLAVHVTTSPRLPYPELLRLKADACHQGLVLTVAGDGGVVLRRPASRLSGCRGENENA
jgi:hypothetical protein